jgi:hypothetical protein
MKLGLWHQVYNMDWRYLRTACCEEYWDWRYLRRLFRLKMDKIIVGWQKLHNEELYNLYSLPRLHDITYLISVTVGVYNAYFYQYYFIYICSCDCCILDSVVFILCRVFIVCCVWLLCYFVWCVICVLCLIVVPLPPGKTPFPVKINKWWIKNIIRMSKWRRMRWAWHIAFGGGRKRNAYRVLVSKPEGKRPFGIPRHSWKVNIKMDLRDTGSGEWTGFIWLRTGTSGGLLRTW